MLREALRIILVIVIVVAAMAFFLGYRWGAPHETVNRPVAVQPVATTGHDQGDRVERAREAGAKVGETVAVGAERAGQTLEEAGVTAKVKSKIALDDTLKGSHVEVSTTDGVVTLGGAVENEGQHRRVLALAGETDGVTNIVDHLSVARQAK